MPVTPDRRPGPLEEDDEILLGDNGSDPTAVGGIAFNGGAFRMWDSLGVFNPRSGASTVFGEAYQSVESDPQSDTTLTAFQNKVTLTTPAINAGTYLVMFYAEARTSAANKQMQVRMRVDGADASLLDVYPPIGNFWLPCAGFRPVPMTVGAHVVTLEWRSTAASFTASIRRGRLVLWRTT